jgi:hypothetical protein
MKLKITFLITLSLLVAMSFSACDDRLEELNTDPLSLSGLPDEYLFANAVRQAFGDPAHEGRFASQYAHVYVSSSEWRRADGYDDFHSQDVYKEMFAYWYTNPVRYIRKVLDQTASGPDADSVRHAMASVVSVLIFSQVTDLFGDVPYSEGGKGLDGILYPRYDAQEDIYADMMFQLKSDIAILKSAGADEGYNGSDPVYNNDHEKWICFANSLRLRLAMRARFADPDGSAAVITECMNEGKFIESNSQNFALTHQDSESSDLYNPWWGVRQHQSLRISEKLVNWFLTTHDPRLYILADTAPGGVYRGYPNGLNDKMLSAYPYENYSTPANILFDKALPQFLMCASEVYFLRAEAALFSLASGDANSLYQQGIRENFSLWNVPSDSVDAFMANETEANLHGTQEEQFAQISTQAWIAFIPDFNQAWFNINRTGYPLIPQRTDPVKYAIGVTNGFLPKRYKYASIEYVTNKTNLEKAIERQGPDKIDTPVWWDVRGN